MAKGQAKSVNRRAFRNDRIRALYDRAIEAGWSARMGGDGHVQMYAPDGNGRMSLSISSSDAARSVANAEAVWKRWVRFQNAITVTTGLNPDYHQPTQEIEEPVMGQDLHQMSEAQQDEAEKHDSAEAEEPAERDPLKPIYLCADGCGQEVGKPGGYARGHHPNSGGARTPTNGARTHGPAVFTIEEVMQIAEYAGDGGLLETRKLKSGLLLVAKMRGAT